MKNYKKPEIKVIISEVENPIMAISGESWVNDNATGGCGDRPTIDDLDKSDDTTCPRCPH